MDKIKSLIKETGFITIDPESFTVLEKTILPTNYKEIDTEEEDRTINIGILEIDAAAFRGITRKFSALLKRNKIEK